jgi:glycosyltransferase involved in cell wall biosynthesis
MGNMKHKPQVVHNGIDTSLFYPRPVDRQVMCGIGEDTFVILGVAGYWNEGKGLSLFVEIAKRITFPTKIILIGSGLDSIKALRNECFLCIDRTENVDELARYYSLADVFINTSLEETFGLTTAEALACGTPAIVFDSTGCPEVIDEQTGICVPFDTEQLIAAIETVKNKGKSRYTLHCRARVEKEFSKEIMTEKYFRIYRSI